MNSRRVLPLLLIAATLAWPAPAHGKAQTWNCLLSGNDQFLWLVRNEQGGLGQFDIIVKPAGEPWKWCIQDQVNPQPLAVCALNDRLHMLFRDGQYFTVGADGESSPGPGADHPHWPKDPVGLRLFATDDRKVPGVVAVVLRREAQPATQPATKPASGPQSLPDAKPARPPSTQPAAPNIAVGLFQNQGSQWSFLGDLDAKLTEDQARNMAVGGFQGDIRIYVPGDRGLRKFSLRGQGVWQREAEFNRELAELLQGGSVVSLLDSGGAPVMVILGPAAKSEERALYLAVFRGGTWRLQQVMLHGKPVLFQSQDSLAACKLGSNQVAWVHSSLQAVTLSSCDLDGRVTVQEAVTIFQKPAPDPAKAGQLLQYFLYGLLAAGVVPLFVLRPQAPRGPFLLPPGRRPGNLLKRLLAGGIDLLPWLYLAQAFFQPPVPATPPSDVDGSLRMVQTLFESVEFSLWVIASTVMFIVYGTATERTFGATAGKMLMKLKVVGEMGDRPSLREAFARNVFKVIELVSLFPLLLLVPLINRNRLRVGDMLARTGVIDATYLAPPTASPPEQFRQDRGDDSGL